MRRITAFSLMCVICALAASTASGVVTVVTQPAQKATVTVDQWNRPVTVTFKDTPLPKAIETLLKGIDIKVTFTHSITKNPAEQKVTAVFTNVPVEDALRQTITAAGLLLMKWSHSDGQPDGILITDPASAPGGPEKVSGTVTRVEPTRLISVGPGPAVVMPPNGEDYSYDYTPGHPQYEKDETIPLKYVDPSAVLPLASIQPGLRIAQTGPKSVTVRGRLAAIKQFKEVVSVVDRQESLPRPVRVTVTGTIRIKYNDLYARTHGIVAQEDVYTLNVRSLTADGMQASSQATVGGHMINPTQDHAILSVSFIPTIVDARPEDHTPTSISLFGHGTLTAKQPIAFSRTFDILASVAPKMQIVIDSGTMDVGGGNTIDYSVTAEAQIELGRIALPAGVQRPGFGGGYGGMMGGYGDGYGGAVGGMQSGPQQLPVVPPADVPAKPESSQTPDATPTPVAP